MNKFKLLLLSLALSLSSVSGLGLATANALPLPQVHLASISTDTACEGLTQIDTSQGCGNGKGEASVKGIIATIIKILSFIIGIIAVIMIIIAGLKYVTSNGDSNSIGSAKTTLIYALVGLVIVALAQLIVHYVLSAAVN